MQYNVRLLFVLGLLCFIRKFAAAPKNLKTNYTFFVKPTCFLSIQERRSQLQIFDFDYIRQILTFCKYFLQ